MDFNISFFDLVLRLVLAMLCGGIIGIERERKRRAAGFRTFMIVCMGAALAMLIGFYIVDVSANIWKLDTEVYKTDVARLGAQVINGIGFLGAGTILITGRRQVRGMTTASGLWAAACMGLTIGAGFYKCAIVGCALIILATTAMRSLERVVMSRTRNINLHIEFGELTDVGKIIKQIKGHDIKIYDVEITRAEKGNIELINPSAVFTMRLPKKKSHTEVITDLSLIDGVKSIEEL